jgi:hypothetical protein
MGWGGGTGLELGPCCRYMVCWWAGSADIGVEGGCVWRQWDHHSCHPRLRQHGGPMKSKFPSRAHDRLWCLSHGSPFPPSPTVPPPPLRPQLYLLSSNLDCSSAPPAPPTFSPHHWARLSLSDNPNSIHGHHRRPATRCTTHTLALCHWVSLPPSPSSPQVIAHKLFWFPIDKAIHQTVDVQSSQVIEKMGGRGICLLTAHVLDERSPRSSCTNVKKRLITYLIIRHLCHYLIIS